jgi:hypothetical protein
VKTACQVASSTSLQMEDRTFHMAEVLKIANSTGNIVFCSALESLNMSIKNEFVALVKKCTA